MTKPFITALLNYAQADEDGIMVLTSRQAIHETVDDCQALGAENQRLRQALEEIANGKPPKSIYGEGIYWWCVETAKKALEQSDE